MKERYKDVHEKAKAKIQNQIFYLVAKNKLDLRTAQYQSILEVVRSIQKKRMRDSRAKYKRRQSIYRHFTAHMEELHDLCLRKEEQAARFEMLQQEALSKKSDIEELIRFEMASVGFDIGDSDEIDDALIEGILNKMRAEVSGDEDL